MGSVCTAFFVLVILYSSYLCLKYTEKVDKDSIISYFSDNIYQKNEVIDIYGAFQSLLQKKAIENFTILLNHNNKLTKPYDKLKLESIQESVDKIAPICSYCKEKGIPCFYLTNLISIEDECELPYVLIWYTYRGDVLRIIGGRKLK